MQVYVQAGVGILVLALGWGVTAYAIVVSAATVIPMVACAVMLWPMVRGHMRLDWRIWRVLVVGGVPLLVLSSFNLVGTIDVPILHSISGDEAVGWYVLAYRWAGTPIFIATAVVAAFFPQFSSEGATMTDRFSGSSTGPSTSSCSCPCRLPSACGWSPPASSNSSTARSSRNPP